MTGGFDLDLDLADKNSAPAGAASSFRTEGPRVLQRFGTLGLVYLIHLALGIALAWPLAGVFGTGSRRLPAGDTALFEPGGFYLLEAVRANAPQLVGATPGSLWLLVCGTYFGLLPLGSLLFALSRPGALTVLDLAMGGIRFFGRFSILLALSTLAAAFCVIPLGLAAWLLASGVRDGLALYGLAALGAVSLCVVAIAQDLARCAVVRHNASVWDAADLARRTLLGRPVRATCGWLFRALVSLSLVIGAADLCPRLSLKATASFATVFLVHQGVVFALLCLRAGWLSSALRLVGGLRPTMQE